MFPFLTISAFLIYRCPCRIDSFWHLTFQQKRAVFIYPGERLRWDKATRKKNLHLIVNNARFLILPWVRSKNLGSRILSLASKRLTADWQERYQYCPVLLETFVEIHRFRGTCYKAANWLEVGETCGKGKLGSREGDVPTKSVWLYLLCRNFRSQLIGVGQ